MTGSVFYQNLMALRERNPELASRIECSPAESGYRVIDSLEEGRPNLLYAGSDPAVLFYDREPSREIKHYLKQVLIGKTRFLVMLGLGLGYVPEEVLQGDTDVLKIIIVEKDISCLRAAMHCRDLTSLLRDSRIRLVAGCSEQDLYVELYKAVLPHYAGLKEMKFLPWPPSVRIAEGYYTEVVTTFRKIVDTYGSDRGNDPFDTLVGYEQFFSNIGDLLRNPGAGYVENLFKDKPAVVVATGPSLKKNIHLLKGIEKSALIISADASLRILHQHNIRPHMVTTIERPPGFDAYYKGLRDLDKTVFAAISLVHPSTLKAYTGPVLFFHRFYNFMLNIGFKEDAITMGMSTANMAYEVARHMGCNPIILVGNDLAFDSTGNTHAPGFILGEKQPLYADFDRLNVPGNIEPFVTTCDGWFTCLKQYEKRIADWNGTLVNATEGGARIRGSEITTLKEAIANYCSEPFNPREILLKHLSLWKSPHSTEEILRTVNRFIEVTDTFTEVCRNMRALLDETVREIESMGRITPALKKRLDDSVPHIETVLNELRSTELMQYFDEYFYSDIFPLLMEWQVVETRFEDPSWASAYRVKLAENFFGGMGQLCVSLKDALADGQKRLMELNTQEQKLF